MRLPGDQHSERTKCHVLPCRAFTAVRREHLMLNPRVPSFQAFSELITLERLQLGCIDVAPYEVDGEIRLAELSHGLAKHRYWSPRCAAVDPSAANASLAIVAVSEYL